MKIHTMLRVGLLSLAIAPAAGARTLFLAHFDKDEWADYAAPNEHWSSVVLGTASNAPGRFGQGLFFRTNNVGSSTDHTRIQFTAPNSWSMAKGTLDFWYTPTYSSLQISNQTLRLINLNRITDNARFLDLQLYSNGSGVPVLRIYSAFLNGGGAAQFDTGMSPFPAVTNIHFAVTWDASASAVQVFINGVRGSLKTYSWTPGVGRYIFPGGMVSGAYGDAWGVIDELRITDDVEYTGDFSVPVAPYALPTPDTDVDKSHLRFLAHYDGNTGNGGLRADYARGSSVPTDTTGVSLKAGQFGSGAYAASNLSANVIFRYAGGDNILPDIGTLEFWFVPDYGSDWLLAGNASQLIDVRNTLGQRLFNLYTTYYSGKFSIWTYSDATGVGAQFASPIAPRFAAGTPIHVAVTWDRAVGLNVYVQGRAGPGLSRTWDPGSAIARINVGRYDGGGTNPTAAGVIDELRISDTVIYTEDFAPPVVPYNLIPLGSVVVVR